MPKFEQGPKKVESPLSEKEAIDIEKKTEEDKEKEASELSLIRGNMKRHIEEGDLRNAKELLEIPKRSRADDKSRIGFDSSIAGGRNSLEYWEKLIEKHSDKISDEENEKYAKEISELREAFDRLEKSSTEEE